MEQQQSPWTCYYCFTSLPASGRNDATDFSFVSFGEMSSTCFPVCSRVNVSYSDIVRTDCRTESLFSFQFRAINVIISISLENC